MVRFVRRRAYQRITIRDWGIGFETQQVPKDCFGVSGIRERVHLLAGKSRIMSKPRKGSLIVAELPVVHREIDGYVAIPLKHKQSITSN